MTNIDSLPNWLLLLLVSPELIGIGIFAYLLWDNKREERKMQELRNKQNK